MDLIKEIFVIVTIFCTLNIVQIVKSAIIIETPLGSVKGSIEKSINGSQFYLFKGIPFAEPPIGIVKQANSEIIC